jgi:pimeloyl-ACP methyl ester carboxylesterase
VGTLLEWRSTTVHGRPAEYGIAGSGPTVVFLHGWAVGNRAYKVALKRLIAQGFHVVAPALPGHGGTPLLPPDEPGLEGYADWLAEFLVAIGCDEPVVLIGHSFGGGVAIRMAYDHPDRVRALVLVNSIGGSAWRMRGSIAQAMRDRPIWDWGLHLPADIWPSRQMRRVVPVIVRDVLTNALRSPRGVWHTANLARYADLTEELEVLKERRLPVAVLWGSEDRVITAESFESLVEALGTPMVATVEGSHSWLLGDPEAFGEIITNVLEAHALTQAPARSAPR